MSHFLINSKSLLKIQRVLPHTHTDTQGVIQPGHGAYKRLLPCLVKPVLQQLDIWAPHGDWQIVNGTTKHTHTSIHYDMHVEYVVCHVLVMTTPRPSVSAIFLLFVGVLIGVLLPSFFSFSFCTLHIFANLPRALGASPIRWHFINWKKCSTKPLLRLKQLFTHSPSDKSIKTVVQQNEVNEKDKR